MAILEEESRVDGDKKPEWKFIRMQNLPWTACRPDIRQFFSGLSIKKGGILVRNVEAFVAFENQADARLALYRRNLLLHGCKMELSVVNEEELCIILNCIARRKLNFDRVTMDGFATQHFQAPLRRKIRPTRVSKDYSQEDQTSIFLTEETDFSDDSPHAIQSDQRYPAFKRTIQGIKKVHPTHVSRSIKMENYSVFHPAECYNAKKRKFDVD